MKPWLASLFTWGFIASLSYLLICIGRYYKAKAQYWLKKSIYDK